MRYPQKSKGEVSPMLVGLVVFALFFIAFYVIDYQAYPITFSLPGLFLSFGAGLGVWIWLKVGGQKKVDRSVQAEYEMIESNERFNLLARATNDIVWDWNLVTGTLWWNDNYSSEFGFPKPSSQPSIAEWSANIHPEDRERVVAGIHQAVARGDDIWTDEYRFLKYDGSEVYVLDRAHMLHDASGKSIRMVGTMLDITNRKGAEQAIVHEKTLSDSIINSLPGILYLYDRDGRFIRWNRNFETATGYTAAQIMSMHPLDFLDDKVLSRHKIESTFLNGSDEMETNLLTRSGKKIPYFFNGSRITLDGTECLIGMGIDVTERNLAQEKAIAAYKENQTTLNRIKSAVVSVDLEFRYTFLNDAALETHPAGREATLGKHMLEIHPEMQGTVFWDSYQEAMRTTQVQEAESFYAPMGIWFAVKVYPAIDGLTIFYEDITVRKKSEQQLLDLIASLEAKNKDLKQFSYIVSHNLRAPIAKISGLTKIVETESVQNKVLVDLIAREAEHLDEIVKDINTIVYARKSDPEMFEKIHIQKHLDQVVKELSVQVAETGAVITSDLSQESEIITIKPYFHSILFNLMSNAIKFKRDNQVLCIEIRTHRQGDFTCLSVKDNGIGIDLEKNMDKMFRLYKRFHGEEFPGRGMGLNMVKTQVESLGGRIDVVSTVGQGSEFKIYLPFKLDHDANG
jgi:PAS domain S-box-containing protein